MKNAKAQARVPATMPDKMKWWKLLLADREINQGAKNVAAALLMHHNERTGQCNPSQERLAEAVGMHRPAVSKAIGALLKAGWISQIRTRGTSEYQLNVDLEEIATPAEMSANRYSGCTQTDTADVCEPIQQMSAKRYTEPTSEPTKEAHNQNLVPAEVADAPIAMGPVSEPQAVPMQPATILPVPANENRSVEEGEVFFGWTIPGEMMRQWVATFTDLNVRDELMRRAKWYVANVPEERRLRIFEGKLRGFNEEARQARLDRKDAKVADAEAGVRRDNYGRAVAMAGWIENPRARPPGADRFWLPPSPGREVVFRGTGYFVTLGDFEVLTGRHPGLDLRASISAYEVDHGSVDRGHDDHINGLVKYLSALPEAQAA